MRGPVLLLCLLLGCGDDAVAPTDASTDAAADIGPTAPEWPDAPASLTIGEGERQLLRPPSELTVSVTATGVTAEVRDGAISVYAPYGTTEGQLDVELTTSVGGADPAVPANLEIPVTVPALAWGAPLAAEEVPTGPEAREHPALILDEGRNRLLVIGGSGYRPYGTPLGDAWALDLASGAWTALEVTGSLPPTGSMRVAQAPGATTAVLFGGYGAGGRTSEALLRVDYSGEGLVIDEVPQTGFLSSASRSLHAFMYDPETDLYWTFGGITGASPRDDVRRMQIVDGEALWVFEDTGPGPSPRYGFFYGFDQAQGRLYVFSGAQGTNPLDPARDLWMLDVRAVPAQWTRLFEGEDLPEGRRNGIFAWDPRGPRLFVFGGTPDAMRSALGLFAFDFGGLAPSVTRLELANEAPIRSSGVGIFDPTKNRMLLGFGNTTEAVYADVQTLVTN
ncbi:MAG: kelch repeat-containing protein [Myxococcota bacterium]